MLEVLLWGIVLLVGHRGDWRSLAPVVRVQVDLGACIAALERSGRLAVPVGLVIIVRLRGVVDYRGSWILVIVRVMILSVSHCRCKENGQPVEGL